MSNPTYVQCVSCGGVYQPTQADGTTYFHACPDTKLVTPAVIDKATGDVTKPAVYQALANRRNENIRVDPDTGKATIIAAGGGVVPAPAPASLTTPANLGG
jgi:hypothetical protein